MYKDRNNKIALLIFSTENYLFHATSSFFLRRVTLHTVKLKHREYTQRKQNRVVFTTGARLERETKQKKSQRKLIYPPLHPTNYRKNRTFVFK